MFSPTAPIDSNVIFPLSGHRDRFYPLLAAAPVTKTNIALCNGEHGAGRAGRYKGEPTRRLGAHEDGFLHRSQNLDSRLLVREPLLHLGPTCSQWRLSLSGRLCRFWRLWPSRPGFQRRPCFLVTTRHGGRRTWHRELPIQPANGHMDPSRLRVVTSWTAGVKSCPGLASIGP